MTLHVFQLFTQDLKGNFWAERVKNDLEPLQDPILFLLVQVGVVLRHVLLWGFHLCTHHLSQPLIPVLWSSSIFVYVRHRHDSNFQGSTNFPTIWDQPPFSKCCKDDMKLCPYWCFILMKWTVNVTVTSCVLLCAWELIHIFICKGENKLQKLCWKY
jgi:hypothetical protein